MKEQKIRDNLSLIKDALLQDAFLDDILNMGNVLELIMANKREKIKKVHGYAITPPNKSNRYWTTYYKRENESRKLIRGHSEEELLDKLIKLYEADQNLDNRTFYQLYLEWLEYKTPLANSANTIKRHKQHYKKYFEPTKLHGIKLSDIDTLILEEECNRIVKTFNLSRKEWVNAKTILNGMFDYAKRKKYIADNPLTDMKISVRYRQIVKKQALPKLIIPMSYKNLTAILTKCIRKQTTVHLLQ